MTLVPAECLKKDPQTLLFQFPSMHAVRFQKLSRDFYYWKLVQLAEQVAAMAGRLLVPRECLHWERKKHFQDRQIIILKKSFYVLSEAEMTGSELSKYRSVVEGGNHGEGSNEGRCAANIRGAKSG